MIEEAKPLPLQNDEESNNFIKECNEIREKLNSSKLVFKNLGPQIVDYETAKLISERQALAYLNDSQENFLESLEQALKLAETVCVVIDDIISSEENTDFIEKVTKYVNEIKNYFSEEVETAFLKGIVFLRKSELITNKACCLEIPLEQETF